MPPPVRSVAVVGGGVSGLAAALALARGNDRVQVTLLEARERVGGKLRVSDLAGVPVDEGAESLLARRSEGLRLAGAAGLGGDLVHPATTTAGVWSRGRLRPLPSAQVLGVPADLSGLARTRLLTPPELARVALDRLLPAEPDGLLDGDVAVGTYVGARMGRAVVDRLVEPLLGGVYAGRADSLSLRATIPQLAEVAGAERSLFAAARRVRAGSAATAAPVFAALRGGVGRLPGALHAALTSSAVRTRTGAVVRELARTPNGWRLTLGPARAPEALDADAVVLALPARPAARLLAPLAPAAAGELAGIDYASVAIVALAYPSTAFSRPLPGSGFLVPPVEGRTVKAATFSSAKWGWYADAAPGLVLVRLSVGRWGEEADLQRDDPELARVAAADLAEAVGVRGAPVDARVTRWGGSLPQYAVGHLDRVARIRTDLERLPGLAVCGAAYDGVGIPACIASGEAAAAEVLALARVGENVPHG